MTACRIFATPLAWRKRTDPESGCIDAGRLVLLAPESIGAILSWWPNLRDVSLINKGNEIVDLLPGFGVSEARRTMGLASVTTEGHSPCARN